MEESDNSTLEISFSFRIIILFESAIDNLANLFLSSQSGTIFVIVIVLGTDPTPDLVRLRLPSATLGQLNSFLVEGVGWFHTTRTA